MNYNLIILMGPSASGKTYAIQNNITTDLSIPYVITIDGGDMREVSCVYQQAIPKHKEKTYEKIFKGTILSKYIKKDQHNTKATVKPLLLEKIKEKLEEVNKDFCSEEKKEECNLQLNSNVDIKQQIKNETASNKYIEKLFNKSVKCAKGEVYTGFNESIPHIGIVDTLASKTVESLKNSVTPILGEPEKTIYYLNLSPKLICKIKGAGRSVCEGKKYSSKSWVRSVNKSFETLNNIINRKDTGKTTVKNIMININYGGKINEEANTITLKETNKINSFDIKDKCENNTINIKKCDSTDVYMYEKDVTLSFDKEKYEIINKSIVNFNNYKKTLDKLEEKLKKDKLNELIEQIKTAFNDLSNTISDNNEKVNSSYSFTDYVSNTGSSNENEIIVGGSTKKKTKKKNKNKRKKRTMKKK